MKENGRMICTSIEICAGAGGQALGLEEAGFRHAALVECDQTCCETLRLNRPNWPVVEADVREYSAEHCAGIDLLAGGVPCPPFSVAGQQLGPADDRDLFPEALRLVHELSPRAVLLENVRGIMQPVFAAYRKHICDELASMGYETRWELLQASDYGVPQLRPRAILIALTPGASAGFRWPAPKILNTQTVGEILVDAMASNGWEGARAWASRANAIAPTIVGGSKLHGGPDLGPTRARNAWARLGVDGKGLADCAPGPGFDGRPRLTVEMVALLQGFPQIWKFAGKKTAAYRQVGNAFPPPLAREVGVAIRAALEADNLRGEGVA